MKYRRVGKRPSPHYNGFPMYTTLMLTAYDKTAPITKAAIPSKTAISHAKDWVDENEK